MTKSTNHIFAFIWIIITVFECTLPGISESASQNFETISWVVVFNFVLQTLTMTISKMPLVSFFYIFIVFYYLFHFGQVFMLGLFPNYQFDYLNYVEVYMTNEKVLAETIRMCLISINAFFIGGLLVIKETNYSINDSGKIGFEKVIKKIFYILLPFRFLIDVVQVTAAMLLGYYGAIKATNMIPGIVASLGNMWFAIVPLFYLCLQTNKQKRNYLIVLILYLAITMLTGNRGHQIVCLSSLFIVILTTKREISFKAILKYACFILISLFFIDIIYEMRETSISEFLSNPLSFMESSQKSNILLETIGTFGETIYTPYLTIEGYDSVYHTWFGEAFVKSLFGVVPDVFGTFKTINVDAIFPKKLGTESAIGGSFSAEMYYNFGSFYPLLSCVVGYFYCKLSNFSYYYIKNNNYQHAFMAVIVCSLALWWVRDSIGNLTRQIVWMYWLYLLFQPKKNHA